MVWFKTDDGFYSHPKVVSIPRAIRRDAIGTWLLTGTWSADQLTDGRIPLEQVEELGGSLEGARALVKAKLWTKVRGGFQFKSWDEYQPTRAQVEADRESERIRKALQREKARAKGQQQDTGKSPVGVPVGQQQDTVTRPGGTGAGVPPLSGLPDPTRPDPTPLPSEGGARRASPPVDNFEPPIRCPKHIGVLTPPPCGPCADVRQAHRAWERRQAATPPPPRPPAWNPETHCEHGQLHGRCEMCVIEGKHAAEIIHARFGGIA